MGRQFPDWPWILDAHSVQHRCARVVVRLSQVKADQIFPILLMRAAAFAIVGCMVGLLLAAGLILLCGELLQSFGIQLYDSESEQQRNFNLAILLAIVMASLGAWIGFGLGKK